MFNDASFVRPNGRRTTAALCVSLALFASAASADVIDVRLNVFYDDEMNSGSGGTWEIVAKTDGFGLAGLRVPLTNTLTAILDAPRGVVNGSDPAGFSVFANTIDDGVREIVIGQPRLPSPVPPPDEQTIFYGVGTLTNGAPNYPGKPPTQNAIGPAFTSLTALQDVPWATGDALMDPAWATGARLTSGTFAPGVTPAFFNSGDVVTRGNVFTSLPMTSATAGEISSLINASTSVRTNFIGSPLPDYNDNGVVDAADYVLWRKTFGSMGTGLAADGNNDGMVDNADYTLWRSHFGATAPGAGTVLSIGSVPEPTSSALLVIGATVLLRRRRLRTSTALRPVALGGLQ